MKPAINAPRHQKKRGNTAKNQLNCVILSKKASIITPATTLPGWIVSIILQIMEIASFRRVKSDSNHKKEAFAVMCTAKTSNISLITVITASDLTASDLRP